MTTITAQSMLWNTALPELSTILVEYFQLPPEQLENSKNWNIEEFAQAIEIDLDAVSGKLELLRALTRDVYIPLPQQDIKKPESTGYQGPFVFCLTDVDTTSRTQVTLFLNSELIRDRDRIIDFWNLPIKSLIDLKNTQETLIFVGIDSGRAFGAALYFRITYGLKAYTLREDALCDMSP